MDPSFKEKKKTEEKGEKEEKSAGPSFHNSTAEGLEFWTGAEQEETWSWRASEGRKRISSSRSDGFNPEFYFWFWFTSWLTLISVAPTAAGCWPSVWGFLE